ncbi:peptidase S1 and S6 chymotrypsin/Hap [Catenulispora acidiphila DSM] [Mycolicibacterium parafortuitum]|uniref:Peptidase S1 and S6 chymotrypsin/Hap [Catenulispora acidiphila DSM] n=2 Tax=Mycolicibacterium parafortuitum TaxID=39692 RepID=A0A375YG69_MYCPF|nr:serine protease [Mycolicibacterium parafortuitum]SRX80108.1 peptidase S1 and S6 chymotrypsin/Hap [Catenulispora acidiphila DSM] [Mycolicibacterium parafortuitum]
MSNTSRRLLRQFSDEIIELAERVVLSTAIVKGQTQDFEEGGGSAFLYDAEHLVTNHHVVQDLVEPIHVQLPTAHQTEARVVGRDPLTDLAVLRVDPQSAEPLMISPLRARLGELCFAFGSPLGEFPESISIDIVSGLKRSLPTGDKQAIFDVIQTDAAINPGNSGGPLVNVDGQVIGVNTAAIPEADGIGFAVPADTVAEVVHELITYGAVERASLGVSVARRVVDRAPGGHALVVTSVRSNSAGPFEPGDVIVAVGDRDIRSQNDLLRALRRDVANRKVTVVVLRDDHEVSIECRPRSVRTLG